MKIFDPRLRLLLLPFGAAAELILLLACHALAHLSTQRATRLMDWSVATLPGFRWYLVESE